MRAYSVSIIILFLGFHLQIKAQISQGGIPRRVLQVKSKSIPIVKMPAIDNNQLREASLAENKSSKALKPFRFAHSFPVGLNTLNSGIWNESQDGYRVWQLRIKSKGAFSINLIFKPFHLPPGARLFLFDPGQSTVLGAFTEKNNKRFNSLAVSPLGGDEIIVQYEEPATPAFKGELGIASVNHDFVGILGSARERRPLGKTGGACNIDINCAIAKKWATVKNSVCRVFVSGTELCTGTLMNNTRQDKTPYVLTAKHCFNGHVDGEQNSVFLFDYESPYCGPLDGDITNSISGSEIKASFDSLDFSLVELSVIPPPGFRPYYAGWDHSDNIPDSVVCIHHPQGDIKKIAIDNDSPVKATFRNDYKKNGFWKTLTWEYGTTEAGSSGGPYFDENSRLIGTLTGGTASCNNSVDDYFERLGLSWDHLPDSTKQLKYWLNPDNSSVEFIDGLNPYTDEEFCDAFTNLQEGDEHTLVKLFEQGDVFSGYWGGTNSSNITEFVEKFSIFGNENLYGVSFGIGKLVKQGLSQSFITLKVYNGREKPQTLIYSKDIAIKDFVADAMNFIPFDNVVEPGDTFFVGFDISNVEAQDTFAVYQALRDSGHSTFYFNQDGLWYSYSDRATSGKASSLAFELIACNVSNAIIDTTPNLTPISLQLYPNPVSTYLRVKLSAIIERDAISVYDILGKEIGISVEEEGLRQFRIGFPGINPGIYFIRIKSEGTQASKKFTYMPF
ncbi:MAG: T9SS type A sorting domain-containing protein [Chlorobi bacterium]|nr:T9SS type A sorting domain-containing protein [Chlorobiota bacterium]